MNKQKWLITLVNALVICLMVVVVFFWLWEKRTEMTSSRDIRRATPQQLQKFRVELEDELWEDLGSSPSEQR